jgi:exopolysaccharide/PEP-CTERM locus tyrosine autokinase
MTDQGKIPVPEDGADTAGKSLLERATKAFDISGLKAASVPKDLPAATRRMRSRKPGQGAASQPVATESPASPQAVDPVAPSVAMPAAPPAIPSAADSIPGPVAAVQVEPVHFSGVPHGVHRAWLREQGLIEPEGSVTALLEEFRIVKRQLLQTARESIAGRAAANGQRILICSPHPGEGKTFCAVNLALSIASERDSEVLLVDADFAKPSILSALGIPGGAGLMDALADPTIKVEDCVLRTDIPGLWVLPAGNRTNSDSEYLASSHAGEVLDRLTQGAPDRIVIFDSPPALAASPAAELAKYVGQALLVVRADRTGQSALEDAVSLLSACPDIKLLLNGAHFSPSGRRFGSYYGYGGNQ